MNVKNRVAGFVLTILVILVSLTTAAQQAVTNLSFGQNDADETATAIVQLPNGHLFVLGYAQLATSADMQCSLSKLQANGELIWTKYYGTAKHDFGLDLILNTTGNLVFCGETKDDAGNIDGLMAEVDTAGNLLWLQNLGSDSLNESLKNVKPLSDGSYISCGFITETLDTDRQNDILVMKVLPFGNLDWQKAYGFFNNDYADAIVVVNDGFVLTADVKQNSLGRSDYDIYLLKIDSQGEILWDLLIGDEKENGCQSMLLTQNGDFLVVGESTGKSGPAFDATVVRVTPTGELVYFKNIEAPGTDAAFSVVECQPDTFLLTGYSNSNGISQPVDILLAVIDGQANELGRSYIGSNGIDIGYDIILSGTDEFYVVGKTTEAGEAQYGLFHGNTAAANSIIERETIVKPAVYPQPADNFINISFPTELATIELTLIDELGRLMVNKSFANTKHISLPIDYPAGCYFVRLKTNQGVSQQKVLIR